MISEKKPSKSHPSSTIIKKEIQYQERRQKPKKNWKIPFNKITQEHTTHKRQKNRYPLKGSTVWKETIEIQTDRNFQQNPEDYLIQLETIKAFLQMKKLSQGKFIIFCYFT